MGGRASGEEAGKGGGMGWGGGRKKGGYGAGARGEGAPTGGGSGLCRVAVAACELLSLPISFCFFSQPCPLLPSCLPSSFWLCIPPASSFSSSNRRGLPARARGAPDGSPSSRSPPIPPGELLQRLPSLPPRSGSLFKLPGRRRRWRKASRRVTQGGNKKNSRRRWRRRRSAIWTPAPAGQLGVSQPASPLLPRASSSTHARQSGRQEAGRKERARRRRRCC